MLNKENYPMIETKNKNRSQDNCIIIVDFLKKAKGKRKNIS